MKKEIKVELNEEGILANETIDELSNHRVYMGNFLSNYYVSPAFIKKILREQKEVDFERMHNWINEMLAPIGLCLYRITPTESADDFGLADKDGDAIDIESVLKSAMDNYYNTNEEDNLTERRAEFVYNAARLVAEASGALIIPALWNEREQPFRDQFLKVIERQCGEQRSRSPEELHGSWMQAYFAMGWQYGEKYSREAKTHPDLVPYAELGQLERDKDAVFVALCEIARQWIYE